jgi:hypothetical protein
MCVCDACRLTLNDEIALMIFGDRTLRKYLEARSNLYCSPDTERVMKSTVTRAVLQRALQR